MEFIDRAKEFYSNELKDHMLYKSLAGRVREGWLRDKLRTIAGMELGHSKFWRNLLTRRGYDITDEVSITLKDKLVLKVGSILPNWVLLAILESGEVKGYKEYYDFYKTYESELSTQEKEWLKEIIREEISHETVFREKAEELGASNVRDLVLGMNDGIVELLGVVSGLSAVYKSEPLTVGVSGVVVGIAGAISMGVGAFISVRSQRQVDEARRDRERILALTEGKTNTREIEANENEFKAAMFTGLAYLLGVVFPVSPFFFVSSSANGVVLSFLFAFVILSLVASFISLISGISLRLKLFEMLLSAGFAAGASYIIGSLIKSFFGLEV